MFQYWYASMGLIPVRFGSLSCHPGMHSLTFLPTDFLPVRDECQVCQDPVIGGILNIQYGLAGCLLCLGHIYLVFIYLCLCSVAT